MPTYTEDEFRARILANYKAKAKMRSDIYSLIPEPKCPAAGCGSGVDRPKCLWEMGASCPRHPIFHEWHNKCFALAKKKKMPIP